MKIIVFILLGIGILKSVSAKPLRKQDYHINPGQSAHPDTAEVSSDLYHHNPGNADFEKPTNTNLRKEADYGIVEYEYELVENEEVPDDHEDNDPPLVIETIDEEWDSDPDNMGVIDGHTDALDTF